MMEPRHTAALFQLTLINIRRFSKLNSVELNSAGIAIKRNGMFDLIPGCEPDDGSFLNQTRVKPELFHPESHPESGSAEMPESASSFNSVAKKKRRKSMLNVGRIRSDGGIESIGNQRHLWGD